MAQTDLFLSYASADFAAAESLKGWLEDAPRHRTIWRDREGILPGAPDYYPPILEGISASVTFVVLLSPRWLRSSVALQELADARAAGKKLIVVVHPAIPRDPATSEGRERKAELMQALQTSGFAAPLERPNWIWPSTDESSELDYTPVEQALATDFDWARRHALIVLRLDRWRAVQDEAALLRGADLVELMADAFADAPGREPVLTAEQRAFLLDSQRHETAERERVLGLYWGAQARAAAFAAAERGEAEPGLALLLAAEGAAVATVPEARGILLSLLNRHAMLTGVMHGREPGRWVSGVAFSRDGRWLASLDRARGLGDDRRAYLLVQDAETGKEWKRIGADAQLSAVAWGDRWLALGSPGLIGWLRWDDWKQRFRGNTPARLEGAVAPDYLAFSPAGADLTGGEVLAWGTQRGDIGMIRVGDHARSQRRLSEDLSSNALNGLGWLMDGRLITAEGGRILVRPFPDLEPVQEIAAPGRVFSLVSDGERWVAACRCDGVVGLLVGRGTAVVDFLPAAAPDLGLTAAFAGPPDNPWLVTGSSARRSGGPAVALWQGLSVRQTLLQGEDDLVTGVTADPAGRFIAASDMHGRVWLWDRSRRSHLVGMALPGVSVRCLAASPAGSAALVTQDGRVLMLGPGLDGSPVAEAIAPFSPSRLMFGDQGRLLLAVAEGGELATVDGAGGLRQLQWPQEAGTPREIAVAAHAPVIAALCSDEVIAIAHLTQSTLSAVQAIHAGAPVLGLALDPSGQRIYGVIDKGTGIAVRAWRVDTPGEAPSEIYTFVNPVLPPVPIAFPSDDLLVIGDGDDLVFVPRDAPAGVSRWAGHDETVKRITASSELVASVACWFQDTQVDQVHLWTAEGQPLGPVTLPEHASDLVLSPDGSSLLVLGHSGALWRVMLRPQIWMETARWIAGRSLTGEEERRYGVDTWRAQGSAPA